MIEAARAAEHALRGYEQLVTQLPTPLKPGMPQLLSSSPILNDSYHTRATPVSARSRTRLERRERSAKCSPTSSFRHRERNRVRTPANDDSSDMGESSRTPIRTSRKSKRHSRLSGMSPRIQEALVAERDELHERAAELQAELSEARQDEERQRNLTGKLRKDIQRLERQVETLEEELERQIVEDKRDDRPGLGSINRGGRQQRRRRLQVGPRGKMMSREHTIQQHNRPSSHSSSAYSSESADFDSDTVMTSPTPRRSSFAHSEVSVVSSQLQVDDASLAAGDAVSEGADSSLDLPVEDASPNSSSGHSGRSLSSFFASQTPSPAFRALATKLSMMRKRLSANLEEGSAPRTLAAELGDAVAADEDARTGAVGPSQSDNAALSQTEADASPVRLSRSSRRKANAISRPRLESDDAESSSDGATPFCSPAPLPRGVSLALSVMASTFQSSDHCAGRSSAEEVAQRDALEGDCTGHVKWAERRRSDGPASTRLTRVTYASSDRRPRLSAPSRLAPSLAKGSPYPSASLLSTDSWSRTTLGSQLHGLPVPDRATTGRAGSMVRPEMLRLTPGSSTSSSIALAHRRVPPTAIKDDTALTVFESEASPPVVTSQVARVRGPQTVGGRVIHDLVTWCAIILEWVEFGLIIIIKVFLEARYGKSKTP